MTGYAVPAEPSSDASGRTWRNKMDEEFLAHIHGLGLRDDALGAFLAGLSEALYDEDDVIAVMGAPVAVDMLEART